MSEAFGEVDHLRLEPQAEVATGRRGVRRLETRFQGIPAPKSLYEDALSRLFERFLLGHAEQCDASAASSSSASSQGQQRSVRSRDPGQMAENSVFWHPAGATALSSHAHGFGVSEK